MVDGEPLNNVKKKILWEIKIKMRSRFWLWHRIESEHT